MARLDWSDGVDDLKCPHCGKIVATRPANYFRYGSPLKNCRFCKENYLDPYFHELVVEPPAQRKFDLTEKLIVMVVLAVVFGICAACYWFETTYTGGYHVFFPGFMWGTAAGEVVSLAEIILVKTGFMDRRTERLRKESEERLKNPVYARELAKLGYPVPREYLGEETEDTEKSGEIPDFLF